MAFEIYLSIMSLVFLLILVIVYFSKEKLNITNSKFYKMLIFIALAIELFEFFSVLMFKHTTLENLSVTLFRIRNILCKAWIVLFCYYIYIATNIIKTKSLKEIFLEDKKSKITLIGAILFLSFGIYLDTVSWTTDSFIFGNRNHFVFSVISFLLLSLTRIYKKIAKKEPIKSKKTIKTLGYILVIYAITLIIQEFITVVSFIPLSYVVILYIIYFITENQDIEILEEINEAKEEIEKSNQTKTDFLSNMSFEIKAPMNLIISICDEMSIMETYDEAVVKKYLKEIVEAGNSLLGIINNILDISKIETGKQVLQEKEYIITDIITNVIDILKQKIGNKQVKLIVNVDQNVSTILKGDSSKLYQAILNIATNAAKYTDVGRITFIVTSSKSNGVEHLLFKISDTGIGIKEEDKTRLFSKGERLDNISDSEIEGTGLGLVITKQYIEFLGGKVWFESKYRVGSTFYIEIPQKIVDATPIGMSINEAANANEQEKQIQDFSKFTALIVDDNLLNIKVAKRLLEKYGLKTDSVTLGKECINKVKSGNKYDIIFMDHMMPEMDGIETLHVLKKLEGYVIPPVIALTANAIAGMKEMYLNEGFDDYLSKPINVKELERVINKFLSGK